jgi:hypothetical protein
LRSSTRPSRERLRLALPGLRKGYAFTLEK